MFVVAEVGMTMGSFAQGFRFAITLILNMTLQTLGALLQAAQAAFKPSASLCQVLDVSLVAVTNYGLRINPVSLS